MDQKLSQFNALSQKDKGPAYLSLLSEIFSNPSSPDLASNIHAFVDYVLNHETAGVIVGRQVLSELVKNLGEGAITDTELRKRVVEDVLATLQPRIASYEEQVSGALGCPIVNRYSIIFLGQRSEVPAC